MISLRSIGEMWKEWCIGRSGTTVIVFKIITTIVKQFSSYKNAYKLINLNSFNFAGQKYYLG